MVGPSGLEKVAAGKTIPAIAVARYYYPQGERGASFFKEQTLELFLVAGRGSFCLVRKRRYLNDKGEL